MAQGTLLPNHAEVKLLCLRPKDGAIQMEVQGCRARVTCPVCGTPSGRVHSRYARRLGDLPWEGLPVRILLSTRRFFCIGEGCRRHIFTEPFPGTVRRYARRTLRATETLDWLTLALGGQAGARMAQRLGLRIDGSTLLRQVRRRVQPLPVSAPRVLGVDDWAWKKGHGYGTILCDLEAGRVVDLLPDREAGTLATWLQEHPGTKIVSRDRASAYAKATRRACPEAIQIADRWHLLRNLSEALRNALEPHRRTMMQAAKAIQQNSSIETLNPVVVPADPIETLTIKQKKRQRRHKLYEEMRSLMEGGVSQSDIARQLDLSLRTVQRWVRAGAFPERTPRMFPHSVDKYAAYLDRRLLEGCRNVSQLWRELQQKGFRGQNSSVWHWLRQRRGHRPKTSEDLPMKSTLRVSSQQTAWQILKKNPLAQPYLEELYRCSPEIARLAHLAREFFRIVRNRDLMAWPEWLEAARRTSLRGFVAGLTRDQEAVQAALSQPWSNGPVEGQVHRLKLIKRQMYGRASFDLLKLRVLQRA
jgi:transposase